MQVYYLLKSITALLAYHSLAVAVGASLGVIGGLAGLIVAIVLFCLLLMW